MAAPRGNFLRRAYLELIGYAGALRRFRAGSANAFDYLVVDFGFQPLTFEETAYGALCRFDNSTTVVEIHLDWSEELILPYVRPGDLSEARRSIGPPGVLLDAIMVHRGERPEKQVGVLKAERMQRTLRECAQALRANAPEALRGDFRDLISIRAARPEANHRLLRQS
jgi:hypothetical protein